MPPDPPSLELPTAAHRCALVTPTFWLRHCLESCFPSDSMPSDYADGHHHSIFIKYEVTTNLVEPLPASRGLQGTSPVCTMNNEF